MLAPSLQEDLTAAMMALSNDMNQSQDAWRSMDMLGRFYKASDVILSDPSGSIEAAGNYGKRALLSKRTL